MKLLDDFKKSKWYSRKLLVVVLGSVGVVLFPDSSVAITSIVALFVGGNVAGKFSLATKAIKNAVDESTKLVEETMEEKKAPLSKEEEYKREKKWAKHTIIK